MNALRVHSSGRVNFCPTEGNFSFLSSALYAFLNIFGGEETLMM
jgi:hypothetical protein